ncbi:hypothetical protein ACR788_24355, partial [Sphingobacterium siyangense]
WESRSVPFFTRKPLLETVKGFFRLSTSVFPCTGYSICSAYWLSQHRTVVEPGPSAAVPQLSFTSLVKPYCFSAVSYSCIPVSTARATRNDIRNTPVLLLALSSYIVFRLYRIAVYQLALQ